MKTYIALFRGINVGGNNLLPMKDLKAFLRRRGIGGLFSKSWIWRKADTAVWRRNTMSLKKTLVLVFAVVLALGAAFLFAAFKKIYTPTTGAKIAHYADPGKALLVIDVQEDYTGLKGKQPVPYPNAGEQIAIINKLIDKASASGFQVVYIRHLFDNNFLMRTFVGRDIEGLPGTELDARIKVVSRNEFTKKISDSFSNPQLDEFLIRNRVDELYLVGLDAAYCVHKTALGALNRGYKVTVVDDAIMTRKNLNDVLKQHEKDGISAMSSKKLIAR